ncbi:MAG: hypothetical protein WA715_26550 [Candidatus Acidiferrum sp.]
MAKTVQQELKELRRRVRQLEGSPKAEDALPLLRPEGADRASFDDQAEKQRHQRVDQDVARAAAYLDSHPGAYSDMGAAQRLAKDYGIKRFSVGILEPS